MNTANLFLDTAAPSTPVLGGSCKASSDGGTDPTGVGFQNLVLSLMGESTEAGEVRTGQQVDASVVEESTKQDGKDKAATENLLGSTGDSQVLLGVMVAEVMQVNTAQPVDTGQGKELTDGQATETVQTTGNAAPNDLLASQSANSWMSTVGTPVAASQTAQESPVAETVTAPNAPNAPNVQKGSSEVNTSESVAPAKADAEKVANINPNVDTKMIDLKTTVDTKAAGPELINQQTVDANAAGNPQAAEAHSGNKKATVEDQTANPFIVTGSQINTSISSVVTPGANNESSSVQSVSAQGIGQVKVELVSDTRSTSSANSNKQDESGAGTQGSQQIWNPAQDVKATTQNSVQAVNSTEPHLPPQQAIESKMIHQIVREAKVQLFDGGGTMTFRLDPPHLGSVNMSVSAHDGIVTASLQTSTETARHALESGIGALKQSLADAGIVVDKINVSVGGDQSQNWSAQTGTQNGRSQSSSNGQSRFSQGYAAGPNIAGGVFDSPKSMSNSQLDFLA